MASLRTSFGQSAKRKNLHERLKHLTEAGSFDIDVIRACLDPAVRPGVEPKSDLEILKQRRTESIDEEPIIRVVLSFWKTHSHPAPRQRRFSNPLKILGKQGQTLPIFDIHVSWDK